MQTIIIHCLMNDSKNHSIIQSKKRITWFHFAAHFFKNLLIEVKKRTFFRVYSLKNGFYFFISFSLHLHKRKNNISYITLFNSVIYSILKKNWGYKVHNQFAFIYYKFLFRLIKTNKRTNKQFYSYYLNNINKLFCHILFSLLLL